MGLLTVRPNSDANKRIFPRYACKIEGVLRPVGQGEAGDSFLAIRRSQPHCTTCNLSREGLCLETTLAVKPGDILRIELNIPGGAKSLPSFGEVCWVSGPKAGIRFLALSDSGRVAIQRLLFSFHAKKPA
jgi:hypothetical protein